MGVRILEGEYDGGDTRACLVCSTSGEPLPIPLFDDADQAEGFVAYARNLGFSDVRRCSDDELDRLRALWLGAGSPGVPEDEADEADADLDAYDRQVEAEIEAEAAPDAARCALAVAARGRP